MLLDRVISINAMAALVSRLNFQRAFIIITSRTHFLISAATGAASPMTVFRKKAAQVVPEVHLDVVAVVAQVLVCRLLDSAHHHQGLVHLRADNHQGAICGTLASI
jgi:hypothetical protein